MTEPIRALVVTFALVVLLAGVSGAGAAAATTTVDSGGTTDTVQTLTDGGFADTLEPTALPCGFEFEKYWGDCVA